MEQDINQAETIEASNATISVEQPSPVCPVCHQPTLPEYYFCPNCGTKLAEAPLSVTVWSQTQLYTFSVILPLICFLTIGKWKGIKYLTSKDKEAHTVGIIACVLLILSTVITVWFTYVSVKKLIHISTEGVIQNLDAY